MSEAQRALAERILKMVERQKFADWYAESGDFEKWIAGDPDAPTREQILQSITDMLPA
jgi:hypothetical protein